MVIVRLSARPVPDEIVLVGALVHAHHPPYPLPHRLGRARFALHGGDTGQPPAPARRAIGTRAASCAQCHATTPMILQRAA